MSSISLPVFRQGIALRLAALLIVSLASVQANAVVTDGFLSGITQNPGSFVQSMARQPKDQILVGGNFTAVNGQKNLVRLRKDGSTDTSYEVAEVNGNVYSIVVLSSGQTLIAGSFTKIYSIYPSVPIATRNGLALMGSDGYVNTYFNPDATANGSQGNVFRVLQLASGKLLVGGHFTGIGGTTRSKLARLNINGSVDTTFNAGTMNINDYVWNFAETPDGKILVCGGFSRMGNAAHNNVARLNADGSNDPTFTANVTYSTSAYPSVNTVLLQANGSVVITGQFDRVNGMAHTNLARLGTGGTPDGYGYYSVPNGPIHWAVQQPDGAVVIGGGFTSLSGLTAYSKLARITANGNIDGSFVPPAITGGDVYTLARQPGEKIFVGGALTGVGGQSAKYLARVYGVNLPVGSHLVCRVTVTGSGSRTGSDWANAMTLQAALNVPGCTTVWVKAGTYVPGPEHIDSFNVLPGVAVYGGFAGTETALAERNPTTNLTTLSGNIGDSTVNTDNSYHVVTMDGTQGNPITLTTVLDGFTISGGNAYDDNYYTNEGGGLYCDGSGSGHDCSPLLANLNFSGNRAYFGGAMYNQGYRNGSSSPSLANVTFSDNSASYEGGAMMNSGFDHGSSSPSLANVTFSGNSATYLGYGGAMYNEGRSSGNSSPRLANVTFSGNSASYGGAMATMGGGVMSNPTLNNVILWGNSASSTGPEIYNYGTATPVLKNSVVQGGCPTGSTCTNVIDVDPMLGPLQDNGGSTRTMLLGSGSSAIDAGDDATCTAAPVNALDQRGVSRPQGVHCDIGAVEVKQYALSVSVSGSGRVSADATPAPISGGISGCTLAGGSDCTATYLQSALVTLTASADVGQRFDAWSGYCAGSAASTSVTMDAANTCIASFVIDTFTVTPSVAGGHGTIDPAIAQTVYFGATTSFTFTPDVGYQSNPGGTCNGTFANNVFTTTAIDADCTVIAHFVIQTFTVTPSVVGDHGTISPLMETSVSFGSTASFTLAPDVGYHASVTGTCGGVLIGNLYTTDAISTDCSVIASFEIDAFTVTPGVAGGHGTITPATPQTITFGSTASFTLTPESSYLPSVVSTCGGTLVGNLFTTAAISADCTVTASFAHAQATLEIDDARDYLRYGMTAVNYLVTLLNTGETALSGSVTQTMPPQLDDAASSWICVEPGVGVQCTPSGHGPLSDSVVVPAGRSVSWLITSPVRTDAQEPFIDNAVKFISPSLPSPVNATDHDILVLFRNGMEGQYDDGANAVEPDLLDSPNARQ